MPDRRERLRPRQRPLPALVGAASWLVLDASPAAAHGAGASAVDGGIDRRAVAVGLAFAAVVALVSVHAGRARSGWRLDVAARALAPAAAALAPDAGLGTGATTVVVGLAAVIALAPARSTAGVVTSTALLAVVAAGGRGGGDVLERVVGGSHVVAAAGWSGVALAVATAWWRGRADGRRRARELAGPAIGLVVVVAATGSLATAEHLGDAGLALGSWWGRLLAAKVAVVAVVAVAAAAIRSSWVPRLESSVLTGAAVAGLVLAAAGAPLSGAAPTGPLVAGVAADLAAGDGAGSSGAVRSLVVVAPLAPGRNTVLVQGGRADVVVDGGAVRLERRADGLLVGAVDLPAGRHTIRVGGLRRTLTVRFDDDAEVVRATLPADGLDADCLDRIAGAAAAAGALTVAGRPARLEVVDGPACAVDGVGATSWTAAVTAAVDALAARGTTGPPLLVADPADLRAVDVAAALPGADVVPPEHAATLAVATEGAAGAGATDAATGPIVVATGATVAAELVPALVAATGGTRPIVLAPWLLDSGLLADLVDRSSSVLVAAHRDPTSQLAVDYRTALAADEHAAPATAAGLEGYVAALAALAGSAAAPATPGLFGTSGVAILPSELAHPSEAGWTPGVALVRVA